MSVELSISGSIVEKLKKAGIRFFASVPCKLHANMITILDEDPDVKHIPVCREEEGFGVLAGIALSGEVPCILMQNSGLGNSVNAISTLNNQYSLSSVIVLSYRGSPGEKVRSQHPMSMITEDMLRLMNIPYLCCHNRADIEEIESYVQHSIVMQTPIAILTDYNLFKEK